jgi:hypothetical protein
VYSSGLLKRFFLAEQPSSVYGIMKQYLLSIATSSFLVCRMSVEVMKPGWVGEEDHPVFSVDIHPGGTKFATGPY